MATIYDRYQAMADNDEIISVHTHGLPTVIIDRNCTPLDLKLLLHVQALIDEAADKGDRNINIVFQRVTTDRDQDLRDHFEQRCREEHHAVIRPNESDAR